MRSRVLGAAAAVAGLGAFGLAAAGCADGSASPSRTVAHDRAGHGVITGRPTVGTRGSFGPGCDRMPATGPGSIDDMASARVVAAVRRSRLLTEIAHAIMAAGLTRSLNSAKAITIFAPEDSAFVALGRGNLTTLLADKSDLTKMLKYHVVSGRHTPAELASGRLLTTLLGTVIVPRELRGQYRVNNAQVVCGNIQTANATIYIVNKVVVPIP